MKYNKIVILTSEFPPQPGGIGNHALNLAEGLCSRGFSVQVICDRRSVKGEEEDKFDLTLACEVVRIPRKKILIQTYFARIIIALSLVQKTDVVISSGKFPLWLGAMLSVFLKKRYVAVIHGSEVLLTDIFLRKLTDISLKRFDIIIAVSNFTKSLIEHLNFKRIAVINNGVHLDSISDLPVEKIPGLRLITVGNLTRRKGQHNVIKALPLLLQKYPDLQYNVVGIPTEKEKLHELALSLKVDKAVVYHGAVNEVEKRRLLEQATIFIMLSETTSTGDVEGFGIAILEANALGIPSIGAKGCGIEDAVKDGFSGLLVDPKDEKVIFQSVQEIMQDYSFYSENGKKWVAEFTWDRVIAKYVDIIQKE